MFKPQTWGKGEIQHFLYSLIKNVMLWTKYFGSCIPKLSAAKTEGLFTAQTDQTAMLDFLT